VSGGRHMGRQLSLASPGQHRGRGEDLLGRGSRWSVTRKSSAGGDFGLDLVVGAAALVVAFDD